MVLSAFSKFCGHLKLVVRTPMAAGILSSVFVHYSYNVAE